MDFIAAYSSSDSEESCDLSEETLKRKQKPQQQTELHKDKKLRTDEKHDPIEKCCRLPPPSAVQAMFNEDCSHPQDDPSQHGGRKRSFAHERGNWASFVYIPVDSILRQRLSDLTDSLLSELQQFTTDFRSSDDFHVSLSRTVVLRHHWIQPLVRDLQNKMAACKSTCLHFTDLEYYCNDEKTRTFLGLCVSCEGSALTSYIQSSDQALSEYNLPTYYKDPSFHISLAWATGDVTAALTPSLKLKLQTTLLEHMEDELHLLGSVEVTEVYLKTGNRTYRLPLGR